MQFGLTSNRLEAHCKTLRRLAEICKARGEKRYPKGEDAAERRAWRLDRMGFVWRARRNAETD